MLAHENPFRSERIEALAFRPQGDAWPDIMSRLRGLNCRGAIIGPKGTGKTTMLEELKIRLQHEGWKTALLRLNDRNRNPDPAVLKRMTGEADENTFILLDGAEQLNLVAWLQFQWKIRRAGGLVITTHRPGRLKTLHATRTSEPLLRELLMELQGAAPAPPDCESLFRNHNGNLREIFFEYFRRSSNI